ncbi:TraR/DksA family transcriptional regulator [Planctomycetaceae bacterium SH139]
MPPEQAFSAAELEQYRLQLRSMRDRLNGDIDNGSFGTCVDCGQLIDRERLELISYTPYCISCAKKRS